LLDVLSNTEMKTMNTNNAITMDSKKVQRGFFRIHPMRRTNMKRITVAFIVLVLASTFGCSGMTGTQQKTLSGAGIGAGGGAVLGAAAGGSPVTGAVVGAGVGAVTGYILGEHDD
jgi:hypothetical protein